jgi:transcriptional regulator with XRE-family HTH domain
MNNLQSFIGKRVKQYREASKMSQLDLEIAINASSGMISRIENGKTNPTKETLIEIATALELKPIEVGYLLGVTKPDPNQSDIQSAINYVHQTLESRVTFAYLLDNKQRFQAISKGFSSILKSSGINSDDLIGECIVEALFDPKLKLRELIPKDDFEKAGIAAVSILFQEGNHMYKEKWWTDLFGRLHNLPNFTEIWNYVENNEVDVITEEGRTLLLSFSGLNVAMLYTCIYLYPDPRFYLVEYTPENKKLHLLLNLLG